MRLTCNIAALCSDRDLRFGHTSEHHPGVQLEGFLHFDQGVVGKQGTGVVLGMHDDPLHAAGLLRRLVIDPIVGSHHHFVVERVTDGTHAMASCQNLKRYGA